MPLSEWKRLLVAGAAGLGLALAAPSVLYAQAQQPTPEEEEDASGGQGEEVEDTVEEGEEQVVSVDGPPTVRALRLPKRVTSQRGHARFLLGVTTNETATISVVISSAADDEPVRTVTSEDVEAPGVNYLLIDAVDDQSFQLPGGKYQVEVTATDTDDDTSRTLRGELALRLTRARGSIDAFFVPSQKPFAAEADTEPGTGQIVAALGPSGTVVAAGLRRGDVLTKIGDTEVGTPGAFQTAVRELLADRKTTLTYLRGGEERTADFTPKPDWTPVPNYQRSLEVVREREPSSRTLAYAQAKDRIDAGEPQEARALLRDWPPAWRKASPGQLVQGEVFEADERHKQALGAYSRARKADGTLAQARFGRGVALAGQGRNPIAAREFAAAAKLDPKDASAHAFRAYVLLREDDNEAARDAAIEAIKLDRRYQEGHLALGIAQLALGEERAGKKALRTGLLLLADPDRANTLIEEHLDEPAVPAADPDDPQDPEAGTGEGGGEDTGGTGTGS